MIQKLLNKLVAVDVSPRLTQPPHSHEMRPRHTSWPRRSMAQAGLIIILASLLLCAFASNSPAQVMGFGGGLTIAGSTNSAPLDTNTVSFNVRRLQFQLSGQTNSATMFTGAVYLSTSPNTISNALLIGSFTNFGNAAFSTNFPAWYTNPPLYLLLFGGDGTNATVVQAIYGP